MHGAPRPHASFVLALVPATVLALACPLLHAQAPPADDPLLGTWVIDLARSRYRPGPPVQSETRVYVRDGEGILGRIDRVHADGRRERIEYRADLDHQVPVSGTRSFDAIRLRRIDRHTTEGVLSHAGRVFGYSRRTISADGRTMTISFRREEPGVNNLVIYRKQ
jgi:hypothetical protein